MAQQRIVAFFSGGVEMKKAMATYCLFLCVKEEEDNGNASSSSSMVLLQ